MASIKRLVGFIWASPLTVLGLTYATLFTALGWYKRLDSQGDVMVWQLQADKAPEWLKKKWERWAGHCIGNAVVLKYAPDTDRGRVTLRHEQEHARQCMVLGVFQPIIYGITYLALMTCKHAHPYYDNPFEIDARRAAGQVVDVVGAVKRAYAKGLLKPPVNK